MEEVVKNPVDVIVIGGGVVGTAIAHELAKYELEVIVLEKGYDLAAGTSKANSGIIHAGYNADPETVKGRLHLRAVQLMPEVCQRLGVPMKRIGSIVVAYSQEEAAIVWEMYEFARSIGIEVELVDGETLFALEPQLNREAVAGLHAPGAGIISPYELTFALGENAVLNGVKFYFDAEVQAIRDHGEVKEVVTKRGIFRGKVVVNAAGLWADEVAAMVGDREFAVTARKGEYFLYDKKFGNTVKHVLFPVPTAVSKGILVTPTLDGNLLVGPNAMVVTDKSDTATTVEGLAEVFEGGRKVLPGLSRRDVINEFAGSRAVIVETEDFLIAPSERCRGMIHVAGIQSPGLTAAPAIGEYVAELIGELGIVELREKASFGYWRQAAVRFADLTREEQAALIERDPRYGQIICRCEQVTEAEIIDAITRTLGARTVGGVKRRARSGMGRCQGGFCGPRILELLKRYGGVDKLAVTKEGGESRILVARTRGDEVE